MKKLLKAKNESELTSEKQTLFHDLYRFSNWHRKNTRKQLTTEFDCLEHVLSQCLEVCEDFATGTLDNPDFS